MEVREQQGLKEFRTFKEINETKDSKDKECLTSTTQVQDLMAPLSPPTRNRQLSNMRNIGNCYGDR